MGTDKEKWTTPARNASVEDVFLLKEKPYPRHALTGTQALLSQPQWIKTIWYERSWKNHIKNQTRQYAPNQRNAPFMIWFFSKPLPPKAIQIQTPEPPVVEQSN